MYKLEKDNDTVEVCTQVQASAFTSSGWELVDGKDKKKTGKNAKDTEELTNEDADSETAEDESGTEDKAESDETKEPVKTGRKSANK